MARLYLAIFFFFELVHLTTTPRNEGDGQGTEPRGRRFQSATPIPIFITRFSFRGATRSMTRRPLSISALRTSTPLASWKAPLNCRAAMPRCRKSRLCSSCCLPWMESSPFSAAHLEFDRRRSPQTASVICNASGSSGSQLDIVRWIAGVGFAGAVRRAGRRKARARDCRRGVSCAAFSINPFLPVHDPRGIAGRIFGHLQ